MLTCEAGKKFRIVIEIREKWPRWREIYSGLCCFQVNMAEDISCRALCLDPTDNKYKSKTLTKEEGKEFIDKIQHDYYVHL